MCLDFIKVLVFGFGGFLLIVHCFHHESSGGSCLSAKLKEPLDTKVDG